MSQRRTDPYSDDERKNLSRDHWRKWRVWRAGLEPRELWWRLLDAWESRRRLRLTGYGLAFVLALAVPAWLWVYPWWARRNSIRIAREWLASGHYKYAAEAAQQAIELDPQNPEPWRIAAELARLGHQQQKAMYYSQRVVLLAPHDPDALTDLAADALNAGEPEQAEKALDRIPPAARAASPYVQRIRGEIERRNLRFAAARKYFEAAIRLEGPRAVNEVPLGLVLLNADESRVREHGLQLLARWTDNLEWGASALRTLLQDAMTRRDKAGMRKWAEALRNHPRCTVGDMPLCLAALAEADPARYRTMLAGLEKDHAANPKAALQLLSWLNQIGRGDDAIAWMKTLPADAMHRPPLAAAAAESLRLAADWPGLQAWTDTGNWGKDAEFLRWTYGFEAARKLGNKSRANELWQTLYAHAQLDSVHAMFAASTVYSWGWTTEAETLWWQAASLGSRQVAIDALGALARFYQMRRDADGQFQAFRKLHLLRPSDPAIGHDYAYFAAVMGAELYQAGEVAQANLAAEPHSPVYVATRAFVFYRQSRTEDALTLLLPYAPQAGKLRSIGFVYGLCLAATSHPIEAHALLDPIPRDSLTRQEAEIIRQALGH